MSAALLSPVSAGWYGKVPSLGDFVTRRLPGRFVGAWDDWLQASITASRAMLGPRWQPLYLNCPVWRFALFAGACGPGAWAGVMMPSVDRVGRCFPLTIAAAIEPAEGLPVFLAEAHGWYDTLDALAREALDPAFDPERLDVALAHAGVPRPGASCEPVRALGRWWHASPCEPLALLLPGTGDRATALMRQAAAHALAAEGAGRSLWWTGAGAAGQVLRGYAGLPAPERFAELMRGAATEP